MLFFLIIKVKEKRAFIFWKRLFQWTDQFQNRAFFWSSEWSASVFQGWYEWILSDSTDNYNWNIDNRISEHYHGCIWTCSPALFCWLFFHKLPLFFMIRHREIIQFLQFFSRIIKHISLLSIVHLYQIVIWCLIRNMISVCLYKTISRKQQKVLQYS